jgi:hypothetical protein
MIGTVEVPKAVRCDACIIEYGMVLIAAFIIGIAVKRVVGHKATLQIRLGITNI